MSQKSVGPKFAGPLNEPIFERLGGGLLGIPTAEDVKDRVFERQVEKMFLLLDHYKIDRSDEKCWLLLSFSLASGFVPGMRVVDAPPSKPGRKRTWKAGLGSDLVEAVENLRRQQSIPISEAIRLLRRTESKWSAYTPQNLVTRHREAQRERLLRKRAVAGLMANQHAMSLANLAEIYYAQQGRLPPGQRTSGHYGLGALPKRPIETDENR